MYGSMLARFPIQTERSNHESRILSQWMGCLVEAEHAAGGAQAGEHEAHVLRVLLAEKAAAVAVESQGVQEVGRAELLVALLWWLFEFVLVIAFSL